VLNEKQEKHKRAKEFYGLQSAPTDANEIATLLQEKFMATPPAGSAIITFRDTTNQDILDHGEAIGRTVGTFMVQTPWGMFGLRTWIDDSGGNGTIAARDELRKRYMMLPAHVVMLQVALAAYDAGHVVA